MHAPPSAHRKALLSKLALLAVAGLVLLVLVLRGVDVRGAVDRTLAWLRDVGPIPFFSAMAVLPVFGFPISPFTLTAGSVFGPQLGMGWVLALASFSIAVNLSLGYWVARYALRPLLAWLVTRLGWRLPAVDPGDHLGLTLLVRLTPGPPLCVQNWLLGLAEIPFGLYLLISWIISTVYASGFIIFGEALLTGRGRMLIGAASLIVAVSLGLGLLRKRLRRRRALGEDPRT